MLNRGAVRVFVRAMSSNTLLEKRLPGYLHSMGKGKLGQLGLGEKTKEALTPTYINLGERVTDFESHRKHCLAVTESGKLYAWGCGDYGKLGFDAESVVPEPVHIPSMDAHKIRRVACGAFHSLALSESGQVFSWGYGGSWWFGAGGLGHGNTETVKQPKLIESLAGVKIIAISAGMYHSAALDEHGKMYTWGKGELGRLGHGNNKDYLVPTVVEALADRPVRSIALGSHYTAAILASGTLYMWGKNRFGELGQEAINLFSQQTEPVPVENLKEFRTQVVACGNQHSGAVLDSGDVFLWGSAGFNWFTPNRMSPLSPPAVSSPVHCMSCGFGFTGVVTGDGRVFLWGKGHKGQLGHGTRSREREPRELVLQNGAKALRVECGQYHSLVLLDRISGK